MLLREAPHSHPVYQLLDFLHMVHTKDHKPYFPARVDESNAPVKVIPEIAQSLLRDGWTAPPGSPYDTASGASKARTTVMVDGKEWAVNPHLS